MVHQTMTQKSSNCFLYLYFTLPLLLFLTATGQFVVVFLCFPPLCSLLGLTVQILNTLYLALLHTHKHRAGTAEPQHLTSS